MTAKRRDSNVNGLFRNSNMIGHLDIQSGHLGIPCLLINADESRRDLKGKWHEARWRDAESTKSMGTSAEELDETWDSWHSSLANTINFYYFNVKLCESVNRSFRVFNLCAASSNVKYKRKLLKIDKKQIKLLINFAVNWSKLDSLKSTLIVTALKQLGRNSFCNQSWTKSELT